MQVSASTGRSFHAGPTACFSACFTATQAILLLPLIYNEQNVIYQQSYFGERLTTTQTLLGRIMHGIIQICFMSWMRNVLCIKSKD